MADFAIHFLTNYWNCLTRSRPKSASKKQFSNKGWFLILTILRTFIPTKHSSLNNVLKRDKKSLKIGKQVFIGNSVSFKLFCSICICILYLFICHSITITKRRQTKCRKKWRGGLKETINLMLIRPPQLQFHLICNQPLFLNP